MVWYDICNVIQYIILLPLPTADCTLLHFSLVLTQAVTQPLWTDFTHYKKGKLLQQQILNISGAEKLWLRLEGKWPHAAVKATYKLPLAWRRNGMVLRRNLWRHLLLVQGERGVMWGIFFRSHICTYKLFPKIPGWDLRTCKTWVELWMSTRGANGLQPSPLLWKSLDFPVGLYVQTASRLQFIMYSLLCT